MNETCLRELNPIETIAFRLFTKKNPTNGGILFIIMNLIVTNQISYHQKIC